MKKTITLALALMMVLTLLAGCGGSGDTAGPKTLFPVPICINPLPPPSRTGQWMPIISRA